MRDFLKNTLKVVGTLAVIALLVGGILYTWFVRIVDVGHNGMAPTILMGDRVLVWRTQKFELGEVALCEHPEMAQRYVLGRVIGRVGHTITMERGTLRIEGSAPMRQNHDVITFDDRERGQRYQVGWAEEDILDHDHYILWRVGHEPNMQRPVHVTHGLFLMSDNRSHNGEDSRAFGTVVTNRCVGRVFLRLSAADGPPEIGNGALDFIE